ncbi:hypothetical protein F4861DRAFT_433278 [Xylaria intraflava]|nr:hypothetical protein F4861DRAFT_433278 [Xylaria intraflava]
MAKPIPFDRDQSQWPMEYVLKRPPQGATLAPRWWRLSYYHGPQNQSVEVHYSQTKTQSEALARQFAQEPVLGFDMEWPMDADKRPKLRDKVALIQLASERKVALFHIALHTGDTANDLIAPTLKAIIESPAIIKAGVSIMNADFRRLRTYFNLDPKGAFELSHLYNLVTTPEQATTRLRALSLQVENYLGMPLWKGNVRTSDWSRPLTSDQFQYAASDAYAGFMLFHCMNAKRLAMDPVPPLPRFSERYLPFGVAGIKSIQLDSITADGSVRVVTADEFFRAEKDGDAIGGGTESLDGVKTGITNADTNIAAGYVGGPRLNNKVKGAAKLHRRQSISEPTRSRSNTIGSASQNGSGLTPIDDGLYKVLYEELVIHRSKLASSKGVAAFIIAHNTVLEGLARYRPSDEEQLFLVPGIGKSKVEQYGKLWLEIIAKFKASHGQRGGSQYGLEPILGGAGGRYARSKPKAQEVKGIVRLGRSREIINPPDKFPPELHTGLSSQLSEADLADNALAPTRSEKLNDSGDEDLAFASPIKLPSPSTLKRKRIASDHDGQRPYQPIIQRREGLSQGGESTASSRPSSGPQSSAPAASTPSSTAPAGLDRERMILRKKIEAYIKSVIWAMQPKPTGPLASEDTLLYLVNTLPRTKEEFRRGPGVKRLIEACEAVNMDVWGVFEKWTQGPAFARLRTEM